MELPQLFPWVIVLSQYKGGRLGTGDEPSSDAAIPLYKDKSSTRLYNSHRHCKSPTPDHIKH